VLEDDQVVLLDLWARPSEQSVWADQTWMGFSGTAPSAEVVHVWEPVRDARDLVVARIRSASDVGEVITGAELDRASRGVITERGYGDWFGHRTGHSIDLDLHGSGPHLDDFETHDVRELTTGVAFSIEPGVYLTGRFGVRSEINAVLLEGGPLFTPGEFQQEPIRRG
jgi:Xaa-Pro aminopeptidase